MIERSGAVSGRWPGLQLALLPALAILPILAFAMVVIGYLAAEKERQLEARLLASASSATQAGDLLLVRYLTSLEMLAGSAASEQAFRLQAERLVRQERQWVAVQLVDGNGAPVVSVGEAEPLSDVGQDSLPPSPVARSTAAVSFDPSGNPFLLLRQSSVPGGASVRAALRLDPFSEAMRSLGVPEGWVVALLGPENRIAGRSRAPEEHVGNVATPSLVAMIGSPQDNLFYSLNQEGERVYTAISRSSLTGWNAAVGAPAALAREIIAQSRWWLTGGVLLSLALAFLLAWFLIQNIRKGRAAERRMLEVEGERQAEARLRDIAANFPGVLYRRLMHSDGSISFPFLSSRGDSPFVRSLNRLQASSMTVEQAAGVYATPEARASFTQQIRNTATTLGDFEFEGPIAGEGGQTSWVRSMAATHRLPDGTIVWDGALLDITELKETAQALEQKTRALETVHGINIRVAAELDVQRLTQAVTDLTTKLVGAGFGAFFHNPRGDETTYQLFTLSGAEREAFAGFPMPRHTDVFGPTLRGESTIRSDDITADPRYGRNEPYRGMPEGHLPVRSYLAVPVRSRSGEVLGGLFFGHPDAGVFDAAAAQAVEGIAAQMAVALDNARMFEQAQAEIEHRKRSQEHQRLLLAELNHRVKNTLAVVVSIADQTARSSHDREEFMSGFRRRLIAIADGHTLLSESEWKGASLDSLVAKALIAHSNEGERGWAASGPEIAVAPRQVIALSLVLHELAAGAAKHGSMSRGGGVRVRWNEPGADDSTTIEWIETSSPATPPEGDRFGNVLIDLNVRYECGGTIERSYTSEGFACTITLPWDPISRRIAPTQEGGGRGHFYKSEQAGHYPVR